MDPQKVIAGKRILIVDDEKDVLDSLIGLLEICKIDTALSFEEGREYLETREYDAAILDIMGVKGFELLEIANQQEVPALMLTAHALSVEAMKKSAENGAAYYAPKDKITEIDTFLADVIEASEKKKNPWVKWLQRLGAFYDRKFGGTDWRENVRYTWAQEQDLYPYPGRSWMPLPGDPAATIHDSVVIENDNPATGFRIRSLITPRYRLTVYPGTGDGELFDLAADPNELVNLCDRTEAQAVRQELVEKLLNEYAAQTPFFPVPPWNS